MRRCSLNVLIFEVIYLELQTLGGGAVEPPNDLMERAEAGDAEAQCDLGRFYIEQAGEHGKGVQWFPKAAEQGLLRL